MKKREIRFEVPMQLFKRYKILCMKMELSATKQTCSLIQHFVDVQEKNEQVMKNLKDHTESK